MGFKLIETQELNDIHSKGHIYVHEETQAQVLYLENDDKNKAFTIGFKTPPYNDNGIAHILEHSVLNGSTKYPSKEPFVELIKGSLNTFVNAMTFSDKTIYPVASTNDKDFSNLMGVYLDAVFQPKIHEDGQILEQEGWHYHLENADDDLIYKGVVYNEMKGATASADRQLFMQIQSHLYPDSPYQYESGGLPAAIPSLTQDEFSQFHETYYHPSNSLTILYGDLDLDHAFEMLEEYFAGKGQLQESISLSISDKGPQVERVEETYSLTSGDDPQDKDFLALAWHVTEPEDTLDAYGLKVLEEILFGNNQAPLKKALLEAEIGGDIEGEYAEVGYPGAFVIDAKYSDKAKMDLFIQVVEDTLKEIVEKGIDPRLIKAAINKISFALKEAAISESNPRGVSYAITALSTWLYDVSPFRALNFSTYLDQLSELGQEGYFESLIQRKILDNPKRLALSLVAEPGKNEALEAENHQKLQDYKASLSQEEIEEIVNKTQKLIERQETADSAEDLAKIPSLVKEDLTTEVEAYPISTSDLFEDTHFYHADQFTSSIDYLSLYFDICDLDQEEYKTLGLLSSLLAKMPTQNKSVAELQTEIDLHTGGISSTVAVYEDTDKNIKPYLVLRGKALEESFAELLALMQEIATETVFEDHGELLTLIQSMISDFEQAIDFSSHLLAANRAMSQHKATAKLSELLSGIDQFNYLKAVRDDLKAKKGQKLTEDLSQLLAKIVKKNRLNALYIGENGRLEKVKSAIQTSFADLDLVELGHGGQFKAGNKENEAFITAQDVNYVAQATDSSDILDYNGSANVLATAVRYDYLWNNIRVKGGAYGALYRHLRRGELMLASYRDPNLSKTLNTYQGLAEFVDDIHLSDSELMKYIIGSISPLEQPLSAFAKGLKAFAMQQSGLTQQDEIQLKEEIIATDNNKLKALGQGLRQSLTQSTVVVIGNKKAIEDNEELFDQIHELY